MTAVQTSLFLSHLTHDVRFAIYSHIVLPPFTGYKDYAGLWLSCRQLYDEIGSVGARGLRMYLQKLSNDILADRNGRIGGQAGRTKNLEFVAPASVLGASVIRVNFPFELPPPADSWYRQDSWPKRISLPFHQHRRSRPLTEDQAGLRKHQEQRSIYEEDVIRLISGVRNLYKVSMNVEIYLVSTESTARRIAEDTTLCRGTNGSGPLASTVLGRLLAMHATTIESHCRFHLGNWMQDCTLKVRTINIGWDFTTQSSGVQQEEEWKPAHTSSLHDVCSRASYTQDHREGIVQYRVNVVQTIQNLIVNAKQHIKKNMAGRLWDDQTASTRRTRGSGNVRESRAYYEQILAANRLNLQRFGIAETETPEFDEDTPEQ